MFSTLSELDRITHLSDNWTIRITSTDDPADTVTVPLPFGTRLTVTDRGDNLRFWARCTGDYGVALDDAEQMKVASNTRMLAAVIRQYAPVWTDALAKVDRRRPGASTGVRLWAGINTLLGYLMTVINTSTDVAELRAAAHAYAVVPDGRVGALIDLDQLAEQIGDLT